MVKTVTLMMMLKQVFSIETAPTDTKVKIICPKFRCLDEIIKETNATIALQMNEEKSSNY